jgi:hypothetical protein
MKSDCFRFSFIIIIRDTINWIRTGGCDFGLDNYLNEEEEEEDDDEEKEKTRSDVPGKRTKDIITPASRWQYN